MKKAKNVKREKRQKRQDKKITGKIDEDLIVKRIIVNHKYRTIVFRESKGRIEKTKIKGQVTAIQRQRKTILNQPWNQKKNKNYWRNQAIQKETETEKLRYVTHIRWSYLGQYLPPGVNSPIMFNGRSAVALEGRINFKSMYQYSFGKGEKNEIQRTLSIIKGFKKVGRDTLLSPGTYRMSDNDGLYSIQDKIHSGKGKLKSIVKKKFQPFPEYKV